LASKRGLFERLSQFSQGKLKLHSWVYKIDPPALTAGLGNQIWLKKAKYFAVFRRLSRDYPANDAFKTT
jgi:hypothetical protein